jgi:hypothetical protein
MPQSVTQPAHKAHSVPQPESLARQLPPSPMPVYDDYIVVNTDNAIIISDVELPDHDLWMLKAALFAGMKHGIRTLVIAGDGIATDQQALNTWCNTYADGHDITFKQALGIVRSMLRAMHQWFTDGIVWITGNHDERIARVTKGEVTLEWLLEGEPVDYSPYGYMYLRHSNGDYTYICHQYNYSKTPVKLAQDIWAVEAAPDGSKAKMNVVVTHTHLAQDGWSPDGNWRCISLGCMRDPQRTKYMKMKATKFPKWTPGFLMVKDGYFYPLTKKGTDWKALLGGEFYAILDENCVGA